MYKILIFGTGDCSQQANKYINFDSVDIMAYIDNNIEKIGKYINNKPIISSDNIELYDFDYIIVASSFYEQINQQLLKLDIEQLKIIDFLERKYAIFQPKDIFIESYYNPKGIDFNSLKYDFENKFVYKDLKLNDLESNNTKSFVTLFPETKNVHLLKDVGMIPFVMHKHFGYDSKIVCYDGDKYDYLNNEAKGLKIEFLDRKFNDSELDGNEYIKKNAKFIGILNVYHLNARSINWIKTYKSLNQNGKVYLKLDANETILDIDILKYIDILKMCDIISVETKHLYNNLKKRLPIKIEYIPNGFYDFEGSLKYNNYKEKENVICTSGRIGYYAKAHDILIKAFIEVLEYIPNWKLKIIGGIQEDFKAYIEKIFEKYPELNKRVIFAGEIRDRVKLENEYIKSKVFCSTSIIESFGISAIEAGKNGCYIITSNVAPSLDVTRNREFGDIFNINNIQELCNLLKNICNDEDKLRENSYKVQEYMYQNFTWINICKKIYYLLNKDQIDFLNISDIINNNRKDANACDELFIRRFNEFSKALRLSFWNEHFELNSFEEYPDIRGKILDFGCGTGHLDILLARQGKNIHGVDLSGIGIKIANYLKDKEDIEVRNKLEFHKVNITKDLPKEKYDSAWASHVFEHIKDPRPIFNGLRNWINKGGYMLISVPLKYAYDDPDHVNHFMDEQELYNYLCDHIEIVRIDVNYQYEVLNALCRF